MKPEHQIVGEVMLAKQDSRAADDLVRRYLPFIRSEVNIFTENKDRDYEDNLSIAMFAFHEAVMAYRSSKGAFLPFASVVIKNRLIDYKRRESRHEGIISINSEESDEDDRTLLDRLDSGEDNVAEFHEASQTKREIEEFATALGSFGLELTDIMDNCPKQKRTLEACCRVLEYAKEHSELLELTVNTKKLPITQLSQCTGVDKKLLERHRKYLVAIFLAYTNGFEIIRGHLKQIKPRKGGDR